MSNVARERILSRVREANRDREPVSHPGSLPDALEPPGPFGDAGRTDPVGAFEDRLRAAGGEVVRLADEAAARRWLEDFASEFESMSVCAGVPDALQPALPVAPPSEATLGVSVAVGAAAQTGSLLLSSREGRRPQILPPVHLVWVRARDVHTTLGDALQVCREDLPATLALHSGPSKSADIGQVLVTGVHGPGRIIAAILLRLVLGLTLGLGAPAAAQVTSPMPIAPEVVARDDQGRTTVRATRLTKEIRLDGRLDEAVYQTVPPISGFIQQLPDEGALASERTDAWVFFDETSIYVSARAFDSAPPSEWVANEMRHDVGQLRQNDSFSLLLDTFHDRRNGVAFLVTPIAGYSEFAITNEGNVNTDWNVVWDMRTGRFEGGWTVEIEIPFKSLRYQPGETQVWGIQLRRIVRRRNEAAYLTALPISVARGNSVIAGLWRVSEAATLVGLEVPPLSIDVEIKPYGITGLRTDVNANPPTENDTDADAGLDVKYRLTQNLTADFTLNTDFAQVEVDEQQVNLTRFSLFFPEKREFFLEGRGNFDFARGGGGGGGTPTVFFSRRIGLQVGQIIPITAGGRVTGKVGPFDVGLLNIQTGDEATSGAVSTNFTVVRVKRDILRRSTIGGIFTNRSVSLVGDGSSQVYGVDGRLAFYDDFSITGYFANTQTPARNGKENSYQGRFNYTGDLYGLSYGHLVVENRFIPEVGFIPRDNFRRNSASARFSPRPESIDLIRRFVVSGRFEHIATADRGDLETREAQLLLESEFENSDQLNFFFNDHYELLTGPFTISPGVTIPVGGYNFRNFRVSYRFGAQRPVSGLITVRTGGFWSGDNTAVSLSNGRVEVTPQLSLEPSVSFNWVDLPEGSFTTQLARARFTYTFTPRMFLSGLLQFSSSGNSFSTNFRFRWEYSPGSELFVVYSEDRDTDPLVPDRFTALRNRGLVVKINRLFRL